MANTATTKPLSQPKPITVTPEMMPKVQKTLTPTTGQAELQTGMQYGQSSNLNSQMKLPSWQDAYNYFNY